MKLKSILIYLLSLAISGCSSIFNSNDKFKTSIILLNSSAIDSFSHVIRHNYLNYSEISRSNISYRGPDGNGISSILINPCADRFEIILYSFNRQDSCVMFSDSLANGNYEIPHKSIRVPEGFYILKFGGESIIHLPPA